MPHSRRRLELFDAETLAANEWDALGKELARFRQE